MKKIMVVALAYVFWYLIIAFVALEIDFTKWCIEARGLLMFIYVIIGIVCIAIYHDKKYNS